MTQPHVCTRRGILQAGGLGLGGFLLGDLLSGQARAARPSRPRPASFGRARSCIVLFLKGGPPQQDTFDLKPDAPSEVRGEFRPISTSVPGIQVCEHLPRLAEQADKFAVLHTLSHDDATHSTAAYYVTTGQRYPRPGEAIASRDDPPHVGAAAAAFGPTLRAAAPFVMVPDYLVVNGEFRGGQHAGLLGVAYDPLVPGGDPNGPDFRPEQLNLAPRVERPRLAARRTLVEQSPRARAAVDAPTFDVHQQQALDILSADATRRAFDLDSEPAAERDRYGRTSWGQSVLLARRLVEAGVRLVQVNCMSSVNDPMRNWDTHKNNFQTLKEVLLPRIDPAAAALLVDLQQRGLLDETLVLMLGEFGRSPRINADAGRDHWPAVQSVLLAGAGIPGGMRYGATDRLAASATDRPVRPAQLYATILHALGVEPPHEAHTPQGRPVRIYENEPVLDLWG